MLEGWLHHLYEGPTPPERLAEMVIWFAETYPNASRKQWVVFASAHARESYRAGYVRGYEHVERDPDFFRDRSPDEVAYLERQEFAWSPNILLTRPDDVVPDLTEPDAELLRRQLESLRRGGGPGERGEQ